MALSEPDISYNSRFCQDPGG